MMLRALLTIGAVQVVTLSGMLVRTKTLAVMLGPEMIGVMAVIDKLLAVIAQTASLSLPAAALRFLPERWAAGPAQYRALYLPMRNLVFAAILLACAATLLVALYSPDAFGAPLRPYHGMLTMAILCLPAIGMVPFLKNAIAARLEQNRAMLVSLLNAFVLVVSIAGVWWQGLAGYYAVYAVLGLGLCVFVSRFVTSGAGAMVPARGAASGPALALPAQVWRFSGALLILTFLAPFATLFVHYRLLSEYGAQSAGWMQAAIGISLAVRGVLGSAHPIFLTPNVSRGGTPAERMEWANRFQITLCLLAGLLVPPLLLIPDLVVRVLYSDAFVPGAAFVFVFVLAEVLGLLSGTYQSLLLALDNMRVHVAVNLFAQLLVIFVAWLLIGPLGIMGAALACLAAPVSLMICTMTFLRRRYGLSMPAAVFVRSAWLVACLIGAGVLGGLRTDWGVTTLLLKSGMLLLAVTGFACLLSTHERMRLRQLFSDWKARSR